MRVERMLRRILEHCRSVHRARLTALAATVAALVRGGQATLTAIGRSYGTAAFPKHGIKRADRLLGNRRLQAESTTIYAALARHLVRGVARPVVLIDWTGANERKHKWVLVAAIPVAGRAIPILSEVHPKSRFGNRAVQHRFIKRLATILPRRCTPIIVADAGFQMPFYRAVASLGWGYVIRVRNWRRRLSGGLTMRKLFASATAVPRDLGDLLLMASDGFAPKLILAARPKVRYSRKRARSHTAKRAYYRDKAKEPWLLATNLRHHKPEQIVALYATRMQIEECLRDTKSHRCGWAFGYSLSRTKARLELLLLISALATFVVMMLGMAGETLGLHHRMQANTTRHRRVLSVFSLGVSLLAFRFADNIEIETAFRAGARQLRLAQKAISPSLRNGTFFTEFREKYPG